ncbi:protoglobin family protein [Sorangium sp. So ce134]
MKHIDEKLLESDLEYRFGYLIEFVGFGEADIAAIHGAALHLAPRVEGLVDAVYEKLFLYDATKRHFVPKQHGYEGQAPADLLSLTLSHEQIQFRKKHLSDYLVRLVTHPYDLKMVAYLDMVGRIHTAKAGNPEIVVPLVQINALMGFVSDALLQTILSLGLDRDAEVRTLRAFNKLLWLQNDLLARHYVQAA